MTNQELANFIWGVADILRGDYKQSDYGKVILPFTILRRIDCVLEKTKDKVLAKYETAKSLPEDGQDKILNKESGYNFHNHSKFDFSKLVADPAHISMNMINYVNGFSADAREITDKYKFEDTVVDLDKKDLLFQVTQEFSKIDLHPEKVSSMDMGYVFEELIRKFAEASNETAGEHFTPREVIKLMVNILFANDRDMLTTRGITKTLYDCACGTGGMLSVAEEYIAELNPDARLELFGQELNEESYAICKADMMIKNQKSSNIKFGNSFTNDGLESNSFDYMLANPPFGVSWGKYAKKIKDEHGQHGFGGRFGAGLPRSNDGSFLFLMHLMSKMKQGKQGSRIAIVFNGSPLFTGSAGSGESDIRKWIIENDMLEAVIAMPDQLFYNTGISTYIWVVTNRKEAHRKGKVQMINAVSFFKKMSRSLGSKRNEIGENDIVEISRIYGEFEEGKYCKIFNNSDFGYSKIVVERPLLDDNGNPVTDKKGKPKPDTKLRDNENVPLKPGQLMSTEADIQEYMEKEVLPHVPDAWVDYSKTKVGYEINMTKYFYEYKPLRSLVDIDSDIMNLEKDMEGLLDEVMA